ncbi:hypothetical protein DPMN_092965 [Dreissena polymorpha]|uniref:Uncharacterized protein n=1 Tax=Dreissena polymorpha TaxID=45954 RepID=A0A9D4L298_DREPO|nr:hypothetical protein DPMN_092965 [Dreissena polymorpha]
MFQDTYSHVGRGMLHEDRITFAIQLARIYLKGLQSESTYDQEFHQFLRSQETLLTGRLPAPIQGLTQSQVGSVIIALMRLSLRKRGLIHVGTVSSHFLILLYFSCKGSRFLAKIQFRRKVSSLISLCKLHRLIWEDTLGTCIKPSFLRSRLI